MAESLAEVLQPGTVFCRRYEVVRLISRGGMGAIHEVVHLETRRHCALKTMLPSIVSDRDLRARFRREATVAAEIESEHVVQLFDAGVDEETGIPFLVMELLKGEDLGARLRRDGRLPPHCVVELLGQAARALDKAHSAGIVHRDLKPENLFATRRDDGSPRIKLLDFGIAKLVAQSTLPETTLSVGTPVYMSPEQIRGDGTISPAADVFALGQIAFTLLVGEPFWEPEARRHQSVYPLLLRMTQGPDEPASRRAAQHGVTLPVAFDAWFAKATDREPSQRFETASELVEELAVSLGLPAPELAQSRTGPESEPQSPAGAAARINRGSFDTAAALIKDHDRASRWPRWSRALVGVVGLAVGQSARRSMADVRRAPRASMRVSL